MGKLTDDLKEKELKKIENETGEVSVERMLEKLDVKIPNVYIKYMLDVPIGKKCKANTIGEAKVAWLQTGSFSEEEVLVILRWIELCDTIDDVKTVFLVTGNSLKLSLGQLLVLKATAKKFCTKTKSE